MAAEVDRHHRVVRLSASDAQGNLHDERNRIGQQREPEVHTHPQAVSQGGVGVAVGVPGIHEASQRWTMPIAGWKEALNYLAIMFEDRLPQSSRKRLAKPVPPQLTQKKLQARLAARPN
jgi:hypothetical protein